MGDMIGEEWVTVPDERKLTKVIVQLGRECQIYEIIQCHSQHQNFSFLPVAPSLEDVEVFVAVLHASVE